MNAPRRGSGLCWFGATLLAVTAVLLVLSAMEVSAVTGWSLPGYVRLVLGGVALITMAAFMSLAFRLERRAGRTQ